MARTFLWLRFRAAVTVSGERWPAVARASSRSMQLTRAPINGSVAAQAVTGRPVRLPLGPPPRPLGCCWLWLPPRPHLARSAFVPVSGPTRGCPTVPSASTHRARTTHRAATGKPRPLPPTPGAALGLRHHARGCARLSVWETACPAAKANTVPPCGQTRSEWGGGASGQYRVSGGGRPAVGRRLARVALVECVTSWSLVAPCSEVEWHPLVGCPAVGTCHWRYANRAQAFPCATGCLCQEPGLSKMLAGTPRSREDVGIRATSLTRQTAALAKSYYARLA